jgi:hypothetical protein
LGRKTIEFNKKNRQLGENENDIPTENLTVNFFLPKKANLRNGKGNSFKKGHIDDRYADK